MLLEGQIATYQRKQSQRLEIGSVSATGLIGVGPKQDSEWCDYVRVCHVELSVWVGLLGFGMDGVVLGRWKRSSVASGCSGSKREILLTGFAGLIGRDACGAAGSSNALAKLGARVENVLELACVHLRWALGGLSSCFVGLCVDDVPNAEVMRFCCWILGNDFATSWA